MHENPALAFPIKKRIRTKLFIDRTAALNRGETQNSGLTNEGDQPVVTR